MIMTCYRQLEKVVPQCVGKEFIHSQDLGQATKVLKRKKRSPSEQYSAVVKGVEFEAPCLVHHLCDPGQIT